METDLSVGGPTKEGGRI